MSRHQKLAWRYFSAFLAWLEAHHKALVFYSAGAAFITACSGVALVAHHVDLALIAITDTANQSKTGIVQTLGKVDVTLDAINRPCGAKAPLPGNQSGHNSNGIVTYLLAPNYLPCGTLATVNKTIVKAGDAIVTTQLQERAVTPATVQTMQKLGTAADSLSGTAQALTGTAHSASATLQTAQTTIAAFQPLPRHIDGAVDSLNDLLASKDVKGTLKNLNDTTGNIAGITSDFEYFERPILHPVPCKTKRCKFSRFMKSELPWWIDLGAKSEQMSQWWRAIPVRLTK